MRVPFTQKDSQDLSGVGPRVQSPFGSPPTESFLWSEEMETVGPIRFDPFRGHIRGPLKITESCSSLTPVRTSILGSVLEVI